MFAEPSVFMMGGWHPEDPTPHGVFDIVPWGFADKVVRVGAAFDFKKWKRQSEKALPRLALPNTTYADDRWERIVVKDYYQVGATAQNIRHRLTSPLPSACVCGCDYNP